ncbi:MAG: homogentisate 1,2-dioxygenase, partial [Ilumatobacteraceae bacterium]
MPFYRSVGEIPAKRHTLAGPADQPHAEELMGLNGFSSSSALLYHRRSPSAIVAIESATDPRASGTQCASP